MTSDCSQTFIQLLPLIIPVHIIKLFLYKNLLNVNYPYRVYHVGVYIWEDFNKYVP